MSWFSSRNYFRLILVSGIAISTWYLGNKIGFFPPLSYFFEAGIVKQDLASANGDLQNRNLLNYDRPLTQLLVTNSDRTATSILIEKSQKRLTLYYQEQPIKSYPLVLGNNPVGDKRQEGD